MPTILCIDDNPTVLALEKSLLETNGYTVLSAPSGPTGLALARTNHLDAVVLDFRMPEMDGSQVAEVLIKEQPNLPLVIYSGSGYEIPEWLKWFAGSCLHKGDDPGALLAVLEKLTAKAKAASHKAGGPSGLSNRIMRRDARAGVETSTIITPR
jgi:CheY-like chemotaxis protein